MLGFRVHAGNRRSWLKAAERSASNAARSCSRRQAVLHAGVSAVQVQQPFKRCGRLIQEHMHGHIAFQSGIPLGHADSVPETT